MPVLEPSPSHVGRSGALSNSANLQTAATHAAPGGSARCFLPSRPPACLSQLHWEAARSTLPVNREVETEISIENGGGGQFMRATDHDGRSSRISGDSSQGLRRWMRTMRAPVANCWVGDCWTCLRDRLPPMGRSRAHILRPKTGASTLSAQLGASLGREKALVGHQPRQSSSRSSIQHLERGRSR